MDLELKFMFIDHRVYYYRKGSKEFYGGNDVTGEMPLTLVELLGLG